MIEDWTVAITQRAPIQVLVLPEQQRAAVITGTITRPPQRAVLRPEAAITATTIRHEATAHGAIIPRAEVRHRAATTVGTQAGAAAFPVVVLVVAPVEVREVPHPETHPEAAVHAGNSYRHEDL